MVKKRTVVKSNLDSACYYDTSNRVFFIYHLGSYFNKPYYLYGETNNIDQTDLQLRCTVPTYTLVYSTPVDSRSHMIDEVDKYLYGFCDPFPLPACQTWNTISCSEEALEEIVAKIDSLYIVHD